MKIKSTMKYRMFRFLMSVMLCFVSNFTMSSSNIKTNIPFFSAAGELLITEPTSLINESFTYNINTDYVNTGTTGVPGTVTSSPPFAVLQTTTTNAAASALLCSKGRLAYHPGEGSTGLFTAIFTTGVADSTQLIGLGNLSSNTTFTFANIQDGFFFGYSGASFGILWYFNGTLPASYTPGTSGGFISQVPIGGVGGWNVDRLDGSGGATNPSGVTLDPTKGNLYKIQYIWLGFGVINFYVSNPRTGSFILVHQIGLPNTGTSTSLQNGTIQPMVAVNKTTGATNLILKTACMAGLIEGKVNMDFQVVHAINNGLPGGPNITNTGFQNVLAIRNKTTYPAVNPVTNQVLVYPRGLNVFTTANANDIFTLYLNPTFTFAATSINSATSVVEYDTGNGAVTDPGSAALCTYYLNGTIALVIDLTDQGIILRPGDVLSIAGRTTGGTDTAYASISWREKL